MNTTDIVSLARNWKRLKSKRLFARLFSVSLWHSEFRFPKDKRFEKQNIVYVRNTVTEESAIFNPVRALRPKPLKAVKLSYKKDPFRNPNAMRPINTEVGTIANEHAYISDNLAKICRWHGLVIFKTHSSFAFSPRELYGGFTLAEEWFRKVRAADPRSTHRVIFWNNLSRSGASQAHKHWQLTATPEPWGREALFRDRMTAYRAKHRASYLANLMTVSDELKLHRRIGATDVTVSLTPAKEKELWFTTEQTDEPFFRLFCRILKTFAYTSFNAVFSLDLHPTLVRLVDRGALSDIPSDIGAMELYESPVIATDPFTIAQKLGTLKG